jgi:UDP-N-acetyl-D-glucosamine dehydrogenase
MDDSRPPAAAAGLDPAALVARLRDRRATIGIVGLGYVGIPLALTAARAGFRVLGVDIDAPRVAQINRGESFIKHIPEAAMKDAVGSGRFSATTEMAALKEADAILICVPTPLTRQREPDLSYVTNTTRGIARHLRAGQLIVL